MSLDALTKPFAEEELHTFRGAGGKELTYIEDETVMDRLDLAFGMGNWSIQVDPIPVYEGVVKVTMTVRPTPDSEWVSYQDFGYPNNKDGQALKESVSDGIRRCGRYLGIARDLYRKDAGPVRGQRGPVGADAGGGIGVIGHPGTTPPTPIRPAPAAVSSPVAAVARSSTALPEEPDLGWDVLQDKKPPSFAQDQAAKIEADGSWSYGQLADKAKALSVPQKVLTDTSKRLFGPDAWKLTDLTGVQRYAVAVEVGLL